MNRLDGKPVDWGEYKKQRCVAIRNISSSSALEVLVVEVSPSGSLVKFRFSSGNEEWEKGTEWLLIEVLGSRGVI